MYYPIHYNIFLTILFVSFFSLSPSFPFSSWFCIVNCSNFQLFHLQCRHAITSVYIYIYIYIYIFFSSSFSIFSLTLSPCCFVFSSFSTKLENKRFLFFSFFIYFLYSQSSCRRLVCTIKIEGTNLILTVDSLGEFEQKVFFCLR